MQTGAMDIGEPVFVVGFPKSGNTWLLRLLCELCGANIDGGDAINAADYDPARRKVLYKVHFADPETVSRQGKVVYVVRDVRDVLVSGFFHNHRYLAEEWVLAQGPAGLKRALLRPYFRHHVRRLNARWRGTELRQTLNFFHRLRARLAGEVIRRQRGINWSDHVISWISLPGICVVRYEDLLADPKKELSRVLRHLGLEATEAEMERTVLSQSFEKRKRAFQESGDRGNDLFLRKGRAGDWVRFLDRELALEIVSRNEKGLAAMDYLPAQT